MHTRSAPCLPGIVLSLWPFPVELEIGTYEFSFRFNFAAFSREWHAIDALHPRHAHIDLCMQATNKINLLRRVILRTTLTRTIRTAERRNDH